MAWDPVLLRKYNATGHFRLLNQLRSELKGNPLVRPQEGQSIGEVNRSRFLTRVMEGRSGGQLRGRRGSTGESGSVTSSAATGTPGSGTGAGSLSVAGGSAGGSAGGAAGRGAGGEAGRVSGSGLGRTSAGSKVRLGRGRSNQVGRGYAPGNASTDTAYSADSSYDTFMPIPVIAMVETEPQSRAGFDGNETADEAGSASFRDRLNAIEMR